jgi:hypothetical protein
MPSIACWTWDARSMLASSDPKSALGPLHSFRDPCTTLAGDCARRARSR